MGNIIDLNVTLFIQLANFLITIVVLNYLLIKPVRDQIAARGAFTASYTADIEKFTAEASEKITAYEAALADARSQASVNRDAIKAQGLTKEQELLQVAQADAQNFLRDSRKETANEAKKAMKTLLSQVNDYAAQAMAKILG